MLKRTMFLLIILSFLAWWAIPPALTEEDPYVWNEDDTGFSAGWVEHIFQDRERPPSQFNHDLHQDYDGLEECQTCHHLYEDGLLIKDESSEDQACLECHAIHSGAGEPVKLLSAYHGLCIKCHERRDIGPLACGECHVK